MREKNAIIISAIICATLIICGVLFWPTLYRYDKIEGKLPIRINRLTGYTEILYDSGWERKVSNKEICPMSKEEIAKIKISGDFEAGGYKFTIYNGSDWNIKRIKLSIGLKDGYDKKLWERIYATMADIQPFSTDSCSLKLMVDDYVQLAFAHPKGLIRVPDVRIEGAFGYKSE